VITVYCKLLAARIYKRAESVGDITMEAGLDGRSDGRKQPTVMPRVPGVKKLQVPVTEPGVRQFLRLRR